MSGQESGRIERLWVADDGTTCLLMTCNTPPMYTILLVRDEKVLRERKLYGRASAHMLAQGWCEAQGLPGFARAS